MHFLCLHGLGTNSHVLETQTAAIRYELDQHHTYDFAEGCISSPMAPEINGFYNSKDEFFQYYGRSSESLDSALSCLHTYIEEEGPFDGVIAFSQGAALMATYLVQFCREHPRHSLPFRCAIFFSGTLPVDTRIKSNQSLHFIGPDDLDTRLDIPSVHIWGRGDAQYGEEASSLSLLCDETLRETFIHQGGHEIPGSRAKEDLEMCVHVIRRVIEKSSVE